MIWKQNTNMPHPFISIGLGIANAVWGDELIYDHIDN